MAPPRSATESLGDSQVRTTAVKQLVAFAAVAVATSVIVRGIGHLSEQVGRSYLYRDRQQALSHVLPVWATRDQPQILVLGASTVEQEIFPEIIDEQLSRAGRPERTYNLGLSSLVPDLLPRVVDLVTATYRQAGHRPAAIVLEVSPDWFTWAPNHQMEMDYFAQWDSFGDFVSRVRQAPEDGLILLARRYALGGFSGDYITFRFTKWLEHDLPKSMGDLTEVQRVVDLWQPPPSITVENHGSPLDPAHQAQDEKFAAAIRDGRKAIVDDEVAEIGEPFREAAVQGAIAAIHAAQANADQVFLLFVPRNPCFLPAGFTARANTLIARLVNETGAAVLDFRSEENNCDNFEDLLHVLPLTGAPKLSRAIGSRLAAQLGAR